MVQIAFDGTAFAVMCGGVASVITATAALVWAFRRDPKGSGGGGDYKRLPPPAE